MTDEHTPGPWKPCRSHEDFKGPYWVPDDEDERHAMDAMPFTSIQAKSGTVASAHDLFEFKIADAYLIAAAPDLLAALTAFADDVEATVAYQMEWEDVERGATSALVDAVKSARAAIAKAHGNTPESLKNGELRVTISLPQMDHKGE